MYKIGDHAVGKHAGLVVHQAACSLLSAKRKFKVQILLRATHPLIIFRVHCTQGSQEVGTYVSVVR